MERWEAEVELPKEDRVISTTGFKLLFASAISEVDDDEADVEAAELSGSVLCSLSRRLAAPSIVFSPFGWLARGHLAGMIFQGEDDDIMADFITCLGSLFSNAHREPDVDSDDFADLYAGLCTRPFAPATYLFMDDLWGPAEKFQASEFLASVQWTDVQVNALLEDFCDDDGRFSQARMTVFFRRNLLEWSAAIVDFFCRLPTCSTSESCATILKAIQTPVENLARISLAHYAFLEAAGVSSEASLSFLDHAQYFLQQTFSIGDNFGILLASIFSLRLELPDDEEQKSFVKLPNFAFSLRVTRCRRASLTGFCAVSLVRRLRS